MTLRPNVRSGSNATGSGCPRHVRFSPVSDRIADIAGAPQQIASLFNHLVGASEKRRRDSYAERLRGLEIDREYEPYGLLNW